MIGVEDSFVLTVLKWFTGCLFEADANVRKASQTGLFASQSWRGAKDGTGLQPLEKRPSAMQSESGHYINSVSDLYGTDEIEFLLDDIRDLEPVSCNPEDIQVLYYSLRCMLYIYFIIFYFCRNRIFSY